MIIKILLYNHVLHDIPSITPTIPCEVNLLDESQLPRLHEVWPVPLDEMKVRLKRGDQCYVASVDGKLAHYSWAQFSGAHLIQDVGQMAAIEAGHCWIYHCRTAQEFQGRGIYPHVLSKMIAECKARGLLKAWVYTSPENIASQKGILRAGFTLSRRLVSIRLFGRLIPLFSL